MGVQVSVESVGVFGSGLVIFTVTAKETATSQSFALFFADETSLIGEVLDLDLELSSTVIHEVLLKDVEVDG
jgi:hypothetical protein